MAERFLPEHVGTLLGYALESGEEADRLFALQAANSVDATTERTQYGLEVAHVFLQEAGLRLQPNTERIYRDTFSADDRETAMMKWAVGQALGAEIGVRTDCYEFITGTEVGLNDYVVKNGQRVTKMRLKLDEERPYHVRQHFRYRESEQNFQNTVKAVQGITEEGIPVDTVWARTIDDIRRLDEVR